MSRTFRTIVPWAVAVVSTVVAIAAVLLAVHAFGRADMARELAQAADVAPREGDSDPAADDNARSVADDSADADKTSDESDGTGDATATEAPDVLNPRSEYERSYTDQILTPRAGRWSGVGIDLDEPRADVSGTATDLTLDSAAVPQLIMSYGVSAARVTERLEAAGCADRIRTGPLPDDEHVPAQKGTLLCIATSRSGAADQGIDQRMVLLEVTGLADDGTVSLNLNAWVVPD